MADNELTVMNGNNFSANGTNAVSHFFDTSTMDGKMALYSAMQTADKVDEHLNEPLHVTNVLAQAIEVANHSRGGRRFCRRLPHAGARIRQSVCHFRHAGHVESAACPQGGGKEEPPWLQVLRP